MHTSSLGQVSELGTRVNSAITTALSLYGYETGMSIVEKWLSLINLRASECLIAEYPPKSARLFAHNVLMVGCQGLMAYYLLSPIALFLSVGNDAAQFVGVSLSSYPFDELRASLKLARAIADVVGK